jgi:hypothetical protein
MILLAVLTGAIGIMIWAKQTRWFELLVLIGWGLLASGTTIGSPLANALNQLNGQMAGWFT